MNSETSSFDWKLVAYESQGKLWLKWGTNAPFRAQQGQIHVYKNKSFPSDPTKDTTKWSWDNENNGSTTGWNTGLTWGTGWYCAYIAEASPNGPYKYFIQLVTDATMGSDVAANND